MSKQRNAKQSPAMTRKEALATVYSLYARVGVHLYGERATPEDVALRDQIWTALSVLRRAIHGEAPFGISEMLCQICYLHYVPTAHPFVYLREAPTILKDLCPACLEPLKAEGQIERLENWQTGEVTQC